MARPFLSILLALHLNAYKNREGGLSSSYARSLTCVANSTSLSHLLRAQREWESRPPKSPSTEIHLHGCAGDQVFGSVFTTARFIRSTSAALSTSGSSSPSPSDTCCCFSFGDRLKDCTASIFLHRVSTASSNIHTRCLM
jgi:hypothetical protein